MLTNVRVVVVDDDADTREVLITLLSQVGADVIVADSTAQALRDIEASPPDVIIADIAMPGEESYAFIQRVRQIAERGGQAPAIALTAYRTERRPRTGARRRLSIALQQALQSGDGRPGRGKAGIPAFLRAPR